MSIFAYVHGGVSQAVDYDCLSLYQCLIAQIYKVFWCYADRLHYVSCSPAPRKVHVDHGDNRDCQ